jgi:hypothetical protein
MRKWLVVGLLAMVYVWVSLTAEVHSEGAFLPVVMQPTPAQSEGVFLPVVMQPTPTAAPTPPLEMSATRWVSPLATPAAWWVSPLATPAPWWVSPLATPVAQP